MLSRLFTGELQLGLAQAGAAAIVAFLVVLLASRGLTGTDHVQGEELEP